jgi:hypothetical protein
LVSIASSGQRHRPPLGPAGGAVTAQGLGPPVEVVRVPAGGAARPPDAPRHARRPPAGLRARANLQTLPLPHLVVAVLGADEGVGHLVEESVAQGRGVEEWGEVPGQFDAPRPVPGDRPGTGSPLPTGPLPTGPAGGATPQPTGPAGGSSPGAPRTARGASCARRQAGLVPGRVPLLGRTLGRRCPGWSRGPSRPGGRRGRRPAQAEVARPRKRPARPARYSVLPKVVLRCSSRLRGDGRPRGVEGSSLIMIPPLLAFGEKFVVAACSRPACK